LIKAKQWKQSLIQAAPVQGFVVFFNRKGIWYYPVQTTPSTSSPSASSLHINQPSLSSLRSDINSDSLSNTNIQLLHAFYPSIACDSGISLAASAPYVVVSFPQGRVLVLSVHQIGASMNADVAFDGTIPAPVAHENFSDDSELLQSTKSSASASCVSSVDTECFQLHTACLIPQSMRKVLRCVVSFVETRYVSIVTSSGASSSSSSSSSIKYDASTVRIPSRYCVQVLDFIPQIYFGNHLPQSHAPTSAYNQHHNASSDSPAFNLQLRVAMTSFTKHWNELHPSTFGDIHIVSTSINKGNQNFPPKSVEMTFREACDCLQQVLSWMPSFVSLDNQHKNNHLLVASKAVFEVVSGGVSTNESNSTGCSKGDNHEISSSKDDNESKHDTSINHVPVQSNKSLVEIKGVNQGNDGKDVKQGNDENEGDEYDMDGFEDVDEEAEAAEEDEFEFGAFRPRNLLRANIHKNKRRRTNGYQDMSSQDKLYLFAIDDKDASKSQLCQYKSFSHPIICSSETNSCLRLSNFAFAGSLGNNTINSKFEDDDERHKHNKVSHGGHRYSIGTKWREDLLNFSVNIESKSCQVHGDWNLDQVHTNQPQPSEVDGDVLQPPVNRINSNCTCILDLKCNSNFRGLGLIQSSKRNKRYFRIVDQGHSHSTLKDDPSLDEKMKSYAKASTTNAASTTNTSSSTTTAAALSSTACEIVQSSFSALHAPYSFVVEDDKYLYIYSCPYTSNSNSRLKSSRHGNDTQSAPCVLLEFDASSASTIDDNQDLNQDVQSTQQQQQQQQQHPYRTRHCKPPYILGVQCVWIADACINSTAKSVTENDDSIASTASSASQQTGSFKLFVLTQDNLQVYNLKS
jgi:hypothetical protein